jgi:glycerol-3-phosphate acyltransferase PlsY
LEEGSLLILAYLLGSFPTAYLIGKRRQVDIRKMGSGTGGAANVWETISRRWGILVALGDVAKGFLAVFIARLVDAEPAAQWGAGLAAIAGHNWSAFMKFSGGRGLLTTGGALLLLLAPLQLAIMLSIGIVITLALNTPLGTLIAIASLPPASLGLGYGPTVFWASLAILLLVTIKRLIPDDGMAAYARNRKQVFLYRLLLDRDVKDRETWVRRSSRAADKGKQEEKVV